MQRSPPALRASSAFFVSALTLLAFVVDVGGAAAQTVVVHDTFTAMNGASITSHVPDTVPVAGTTWTYLAGYTPTIVNNTLTTNAPGVFQGSGHESVFVQSGVADGTIAVDFKP